MADTATLRPLTARDKTLLDPRSDADILAQARERFQIAMDAESAERLNQEEALRFRSGQHWPEHLLMHRNLPGQERPCLSIPRSEAFIQQVVNTYRKNPLAMRVRPKTSGEDAKRVADILEGKLRDIEQESEADIAYTVALDQATGQGCGYWRLQIDYEAPTSMQQCVKIQPIYNRMSVYLDPAAVHPAALDAAWGFVVERWSTSHFCQQYDVQPVDAPTWLGAVDNVWHTGAEVQVANYYYKVWATETLVQLPNGRTLLRSELTEDPDPTWPTRETQICTVYGVKMVGHAVLEKTRWPGPYIPLIRVEGQRLDSQGRTQRTGMIQASKDSAFVYDCYRSAELEAIALAPKAPYILYAEQIQGYEHLWNQSNNAQLPYLPIRATVQGGQVLPPPRREVAEPAIQAISMAAQLAAQDVQASLGMYGPMVGEPSNERSGAAIDARKVEGEQTSYGYTANLAWALRACGLQILAILPTLYSGPSLLRQVGQDGTVSHTPVNTPYRDEQGQMQEHLLARGEYEVTISSGPSYETSRMATADKLGTMLGAVQPEIQRYFLDLWAGSLDFPASDEMSQRLKTLVPPEALAASEQKDPRTQLVAMHNQLKAMGEQAQQLAQQLQQSKVTEQAATQQVALLEQSLAAMQARLADKSQENQLQDQQQRQAYDIDLGKLRLEEQKLLFQMQHAQNGQGHATD